MLRNFLKITFRNFSKNKVYVFINILGLGFSMACCIVAYLNSKYGWDFDKNHLNHEKIFKIQSTKAVQNAEVPYGFTPLALGYQIKNEASGITHVSRYNVNGLVLKKELKVINQDIAFVDDDYFEMFTFPLLYGTYQSLLDRSQIILAQHTSEAYFGDKNPVGEIIHIITEEGLKIPMTVGAVLETLPSNTSMRFNAITHFDNYLKIRSLTNNNWKRFISSTFIMTDDGNVPQELVDDINARYIDIQNEAKKDFLISSYFVERLSTLGVNTHEMRSVWLYRPPPPEAVTVPMIMATLMLLIACFNFTNTSISISSKRLKEIGIRKVMGSGKRQLIVQFLGENLVLTFLSLLLAVGVAYFLVPAYSALWDFIDLELNLIGNFEVYGFLIGLALVTSLIAGGYPALFISSFQPVKILKGNLSLGGANIFSKVLLGLQYMFTMIALISALAFSNNSKYQNELDVGFEREKVISVRTESQSEYEKFFNAVSQMPDIDQVAGTDHHIGRWSYSTTLKSPEMEIDALMMNLSLEYADLMDLKILEGRYFDKDLYDHDRLHSIIVNEQMAKEYGWEDPIGQTLKTNDNTQLVVVGVMKDFYMYGFFDTVEASAFRLADRNNANFVVIRTDKNLKEVYEKLESEWYGLAPDTPFEATYQSEIMAESELVNKNVMLMFRFLGFLALALSSIGLYTLVSLTVIKRTKEMGVRKVLGASIPQILVLFNKSFFWLLLVAALVGSVLSYFAIDSLMGVIFSAYQAISIPTVTIPFIFLMALAVGIASIRIFKSAAKNPVDSLRYE